MHNRMGVGLWSSLWGRHNNNQIIEFVRKKYLDFNPSIAHDIPKRVQWKQSLFVLNENLCTNINDHVRLTVWSIMVLYYLFKDLYGDFCLLYWISSRICLILELINNKLINKLIQRHKFCLKYWNIYFINL